jgi:putative heme-binding domain-containing protein
VVLRALGDDHNWFVRKRALALAPSTPRVKEKLVALVMEPSPRVRMELALVSEDAAVLTRFAAADREDKWISAALLSHAPEVVAAFLKPLTGDPAFAKESPQFAAKLVELLAASQPDSREQLLEFVAGRGARPALLRAFGDGLRRGGTTIEKADKEHKLAAVFAKAADTVRDAKAADAVRIEAMQLVSLDTPEQAMPALLACLGKSQPEAVQAAGVAALGQFGGSEVTDAFIAHWPDLSKKARAAAFAVMLARPERAAALLNAIGAKRIAVGELTASDTQALFKHKDPAVAKLADKVLAELKPPSREETVAKFKAALTTKGDASRGREIYAQRCISCHRIGEQGSQLGPDLITVKAKGRDGILAAILEPNKEVAPQFISYTVNTKDGQSLMGFITKDDASGLTLKMIGGAEQTIPRAQIKGSSSSGQSLMPEGIEAGMDAQAMADLLTFIEELK